MAILSNFERYRSFFNMLILFSTSLIILFDTKRFLFNRFSFKINTKIFDLFFREKLFLFIILINFCGLVGRWDSFSGWPLFTLLFRFSVWISTIFRWLNNNFQRFFRHLTPRGLPWFTGILITFIEIFRILIRPLTLGIRLCANILGGHLIFDLIEEFSLSISRQILLTLYERFVCFIQALIFSLLTIRYFEEGVENR